MYVLKVWGVPQNLRSWGYLVYEFRKYRIPALRIVWFLCFCPNWWSFLCQDRPIFLQTLNSPASNRQCLNLVPRSWAAAAARGLSWVEVARGWQMLVILPHPPVQAFQGFGRGSACNLKGSLTWPPFCWVAPCPSPEKAERERKRVRHHYSRSSRCRTNTPRVRARSVETPANLQMGKRISDDWWAAFQIDPVE